MTSEVSAGVPSNVIVEDVALLRLHLWGRCIVARVIIYAEAERNVDDSEGLIVIKPHGHGGTCCDGRGPDLCSPVGSVSCGRSQRPNQARAVGHFHIIFRSLVSCLDRDHDYEQAGV